MVSIIIYVGDLIIVGDDDTEIFYVKGLLKKKFDELPRENELGDWGLVVLVTFEHQTVVYLSPLFLTHPPIIGPQLAST